AIASAIVTFLVQRTGGAVESLDYLPLGLRIKNAMVSYLIYIGQAVWPARLAVFYPHPLNIPWWQPAGAAAVLILISLTVWRFRSRFPYLAVGWFWFVGTLVPVIGLVQVGSQ